MAVVVFDATEWLNAHPQFVGRITEAQLNDAFDVACLLLDNTDNSPVPYDPEHGIETRRILLNLLVCHLATLALRSPEQAGALTSATEGSVSTGFQIPQAANADWWMQTPCGQTFWQAVRRFIVGGRYYPFPNYHPWG